MSRLNTTGTFPQRLDLDKLDVLIDESALNLQSSQYFTIEGLGATPILGYGKHFAKLIVKDPPNTNRVLKDATTLAFEVKDSIGQVVFSSVASKPMSPYYDAIDGAAPIYIWIDRKSVV